MAIKWGGCRDATLRYVAVPAAYQATMKRYLLCYLILHVLLWGGGLLWVDVLPPKTMHMLLFYTLQALCVLLYTARAVKKQYTSFTLMAQLMAFRLITACVYVVLTRWGESANQGGFILQFMLLYLLYLIVELAFFLFPAKHTKAK